MEINQTENQQIDTLQKLLRKYFKLILIGFAALFIIIAGVQYWRNTNLKNSMQASDLYQAMLIADYTRDKKTLQAKGKFLVEEFPQTPYAQFGSLLLAKNYVQDSEFEAAEQQLNLVINNKSAKNIVIPIAKLRLATILRSQGKTDEALKLLSGDVDKAYLALYEEARGDLYLASNNIDAAKESYRQAMQNESPNAQSPLLQMKLIDLGVEVNA